MKKPTIIISIVLLIIILFFIFINSSGDKKNLIVGKYLQQNPIENVKTAPYIELFENKTYIYDNGQVVSTGNYKISDTLLTFNVSNKNTEGLRLTKTGNQLVVDYCWDGYSKREPWHGFALKKDGNKYIYDADFMIDGTIRENEIMRKEGEKETDIKTIATTGLKVEFLEDGSFNMSCKGDLCNSWTIGNLMAVGMDADYWKDCKSVSCDVNFKGTYKKEKMICLEPSSKIYVSYFGGSGYFSISGIFSGNMMKVMEVITKDSTEGEDVFTKL